MKTSLSLFLVILVVFSPIGFAGEDQDLKKGRLLDSLGYKNNGKKKTPAEIARAAPVNVEKEAYGDYDTIIGQIFKYDYKPQNRIADPVIRKYIRTLMRRMELSIEQVVAKEADGDFYEARKFLEERTLPNARYVMARVTELDPSPHAAEWFLSSLESWRYALMIQSGDGRDVPVKVLQSFKESKEKGRGDYVNKGFNIVFRYCHGCHSNNRFNKNKD